MGSLSGPVFQLACLWGICGRGMGIPSAGASQTAQRNSMILNGSIDKVLLLIYYVSIMCTKGVSIMASEKRHRVVVYVNEELKLRAEKSQIS